MKFWKYIIVLLVVFLSCETNAQDKFLNTTIEFIVNTDNVIDNEGFSYYINTIIPEINNNISHVDKILIIGSASPEGNEINNIKLKNKRSEKIYRYLSKLISKDKIEINNNCDLFISKTGTDKDDYQKLRAVYFEVKFKNVKEKNHTVFIEKYNTTYVKEIDTLFIEKKAEKNDKLVFSIYNSLSEDLLKRLNIGAEIYFKQMSFFIDGSFSDGKFYNKNYNIYYWHTGLRKYFNDNYNKIFIELYGRTGYFDTDLFFKNDNGVFGIFFGGGIGIGYKFNISKHWKMSPIIRFGFDDFKFKHYYNEIGGVDVSFDKYVDGKLHLEEVNKENQNKGNIYINEKIINREFFNNCYNMYWFGATYIGITIQRDFYIDKRRKE